jgi:hypothetical protein
MALIYALPDPSSTIDHVGFTVAGAGNAYLALKDPVGSPDDDTTYVWTTTANAYLVILMAIPAGILIVNSVTVNVRVRAVTVGQGPQTSPYIKLGGNKFASPSSTALTTSYQDIAYAWATNPNTGLAWQPADLYAAGGISGGILDQAQTDETRMTQAYITIDGLAAPGKIGAARDVGSRIARISRRPIPTILLRPAFARPA